MNFRKKNKLLKHLGVACFIISLLLPVAIPVFDDISFDDNGIMYLVFGWYLAFSLTGISWWANVFLLLSWLSRKNLKLSLIYDSIALFLALAFIFNAHVFHVSMGIVGGGGNSSITPESALPGIGYIFWLGSLVLFLLRSRAKFLKSREITKSTI